MGVQVECILFNSHAAHFLFAIVLKVLDFKPVSVLSILQTTQRKKKLLIAVNEPLKAATISS